MKFRHPTGVRLALTTGRVTIVGPEWRPLHVDFHREAMANGCECDQTTVRTNPLTPPGKSETAVDPIIEGKHIRAALIRMVERNAEDDFTGSGTPNLNTLAKECGFKPDRTEALAVWHQLEEEAKSAGDNPPETSSNTARPTIE